MFSKNSDLNGSVKFPPAFPSRTISKLHKIFVTPKMFKKAITDIDPS